MAEEEKVTEEEIEKHIEFHKAIDEYRKKKSDKEPEKYDVYDDNAPIKKN